LTQLPANQQERAQSEQIVSSGGPGGEATTDVVARLEKYLAEAAVEERMLKNARVAGVVGLILITMLIVLLIEGLQNTTLRF